MSSTLSSAEVGVLLHAAAIVPQAGSPLNAAAAAPGDAPTVAGLADHGWLLRTDPPQLAPDAVDVLWALAAPRGRLDLVMGAAEGLARLSLFRAAGGNGQRWVRFQRDPQQQWTHLESFYQTEAILGRITQVVDLTSNVLTPRFSVVWDWVRFQVLLGLVDVYRQASLRAILDRGRTVTAVFTVDDVLDVIKQGLAHPHYYWAVSLGRLLAPRDLNLNRTQISETLEALTGEEHVRAAGGGGWRLGRGITELAVSLLLVPSFMSVHATSPDGAAHVALVRGANTLWRFLFKPDGAVEIGPVTGPATIEELRRVLAAVPLPPPVAPLTPDKCPQCASSLPADALFCARCGTRLEAPRTEHVV